MSDDQWRTIAEAATDAIKEMAARINRLEKRLDMLARFCCRSDDPNVTIHWDDNEQTLPVPPPPAAQAENRPAPPEAQVGFVDWLGWTRVHDGWRSQEGKVILDKDCPF